MKPGSAPAGTSASSIGFVDCTDCQSDKIGLRRSGEDSASVRRTSCATQVSPYGCAGFRDHSASRPHPGPPARFAQSAQTAWEVDQHAWTYTVMG